MPAQLVQLAPLASQVAQSEAHPSCWEHSQSPPLHDTGVVQPSSHTQAPSSQRPWVPHEEMASQGRGGRISISTSSGTAMDRTSADDWSLRLPATMVAIRIREAGMAKSEARFRMR